MRGILEETRNVIGQSDRCLSIRGVRMRNHIAQFMASHSRFRAGSWIAEHFSLYSSRQGRNGSIYTEEAAYNLAF